MDQSSALEARRRARESRSRPWRTSASRASVKGVPDTTKAPAKVSAATEIEVVVVEVSPATGTPMMPEGPYPKAEACTVRAEAVGVAPEAIREAAEEVSPQAMTPDSESTTVGSQSAEPAGDSMEACLSEKLTALTLLPRKPASRIPRWTGAVLSFVYLPNGVSKVDEDLEE